MSCRVSSAPLAIPWCIQVSVRSKTMEVLVALFRVWVVIDAVMGDGDDVVSCLVASLD